jgi:putative ABC transport system permease protein
MILSPGSVKNLSYNFVATAQVPEEDELALQTFVAESLPNVTAISMRQILMRAREVLDRISLLVRMLSVFTIVTGLVILSGAIASTKFRRMREAAILKTVGATKRAIAGILGYEYLLLGLIAGGVGSLLSILFSYGIDKHLVRLDWGFRPLPIIIAVMATVFLVWAIGLLSSWGILKNKPLQTLRHEG